MKTPETPIENLRNLLPKAPVESEESSSEFNPRFVSRPPKPKTAGTRNLQWGGFLMVLAGLAALAGQVVIGPRAIVSILSSLGIFLVLWILARARIFQQRNGVFLGLGLVALVGISVAWLEWGYGALQRWVKPTGNQVPGLALEMAAPAPTAVPAEIPLLTKALSIQPADPNQTLVRVLKESKVVVSGKPYLVAVNEVFGFEQIKEGAVVFRANDLLLSLPVTAVELIEKSAPPAPMPPKPDLTAAQLTQRAVAETVKHYPALGVKDSAENEMFLQAYRQLRNSGSEMLKDPEWPIMIAESLARREGWQDVLAPLESKPEPAPEPKPQPEENEPPKVESRKSGGAVKAPPRQEAPEPVQ